MNGNMELWKGHDVEKVTLSDGEYWMPVCPTRLCAYATDIYPDNYRGDQKVKFGTGRQALHIRMEYDFNYEDADAEDWSEGQRDTDVPAAVYRAGTSVPLWTGCLNVRDIATSAYTVAETELDAGPHFIMVCNVGLADVDYENMVSQASRIPCGLRYDFMVCPDGKDLPHPVIREIRIVQRPFEDWKAFVMEHYIEGRTLDVRFVLDEPFKTEGNYLQMDVFDESLNWRGWSGYASREGCLDIIGYYPIIDGRYQFVLRHNGTPFVSGTFVCNQGNCTVECMEVWRDDHVLAGVMPDRYNRSWNLVTDDTTYGRQLKLLAEVWNWDNLTDSAAWECLKKRLSEV